MSLGCTKAVEDVEEERESYLEILCVFLKLERYYV